VKTSGFRKNASVAASQAMKEAAPPVIKIFLHRNLFGNETSVLLAIDMRFGFGRVSSTKTLLCTAMQWKRLRQAVFSPRPPSMNRDPAPHNELICAGKMET
jgi:hypothetical protein